MNREEAINIVRNIYQTDAEKEALQVLIPELRESEDERIRKGLIYHLKELRDWKAGSMSPIKVKEHYDAWIAYLEKHKEQKPGEDSEYRKAYLDGWNARNLQAAREQKPAEWSEHQHKLLNYAISITEDAEVKSFLESLRNTSPKVEWSEEDKRIFNELLDHCNTKNATWYNFLKSLRPDSYKNCNGHWKPSKEQMAALAAAKIGIDTDYELLESLYEQLKAL